MDFLNDIPGFLIVIPLGLLLGVILIFSVKDKK